jgi:hypothetical protein
MFFAADFYGVFHHTFTTIYAPFTTQNATFCTPDFSKTPEKQGNHRAEKNCAAPKFKAGKSKVRAHRSSQVADGREAG